ncbi:TolC family protein [Bacteriovorax sp. PP10]|uniref:TolC family protein n=1 Tax=Bacteriovorax antarcticus TaxID=3088717 RepID=A0ABU5VXG6_9BACT|nr:TolC family protein [Bacteriovorax sp. PP10]MEA9357759.1 TolC family protein [Bacteriovorax sp. PP10]
MTKNLFLSLAVLSLLTPKVLLSQDNDDTIETLDSSSSTSNEELSDGPQTLPAGEAPMPQTESIPSKKVDEMTEDVENLEPVSTPAPAGSTLQQRTGVIPEEELLKPKNPKKVEKVRSQKQTTETEMYVQQDANKYKLNDIYKNLQLNDVIEQGLRKNYDQNIRGQRQELNEISFSGAKSAFWLPELKVTLNTDNQKISNLHSSSRPPLVPNSTSPSGVLGLSLGDYTVFNWGKDYALYLNKKSVYERNTQIFNESKRELKLDLINSFFALMSSKNIEKIRQEELRQTSFVYRLSKEKITVGKTSKQDYYQARSEYLKSQNDYHDAKIVADQADEGVAFQIADAVGTKYVINEALDYRRLKITLDEVVAIAEKNNPTLLTNKVIIDNAERDYDVALKDNMPLPKFSINLGAYNHRFGPGTNTTRYETYSGGGNVELVASINTTWSLTGQDGFLNSNRLATSRITKEIAMKEFEKNTHYTQSNIRQTYKTILSLQNQLVILEARLPSLQKTFDTILDNYLGGRTKFYDFSMALDDLTTTKIFYEQIKLQHLREKLTLARLAGIEDFPGENFELLAKRAKGK